MNDKNELVLSYPRFIIHWMFLFGIILLLISCNDDDCIHEDGESNYPALMMVNETSDNISKAITSVSLVGYQFSNLNILEGDTQVFNLDTGMPGGYEDINVIVRLSGPQIISENIEVSFQDGDTKTITVKGCISFGSCNGYYLE